MTVIEALAIIAPQFDSLSSIIRGYYSVIAEQQTSECEFDDDYIFASANLAAHMLTLRGRVGTGGQVSSAKEGDLQVMYATISANDTLLTTSYGQEYDRLRKMHIIPLRVAFNTSLC